MQSERRGKYASLSEVAEATTPIEELNELRTGFEKILSEKGQVIDPIGGVTGNLFDLAFGTKRVFYSVDVEVKDQNMTVSAFRKKSRHPERETLHVDIGMHSSSGERVHLALPPGEEALWVYHDRSIIGHGIKRESPTRVDIALYRKALVLIQNSQK